MNLKKYLQQSAEKDAYALLTEEDEAFIEQLVKNHPIPEEKPKRRRRKRRSKKKEQLSSENEGE